MKIFRKIQKSSPLCTINNLENSDWSSFRNTVAGKANIYVFYHLKEGAKPDSYKPEVVYEDNEKTSCSGCCARQAISDDWKLLGALPKSKAFNFGGEEEYFELTADGSAELNEEIVRYAKDKLLSYLAYRERSVSECISYLRNLPLNQDAEQKLIKQAIDSNYINDQRFAALTVESSLSKNKSYIDTKAALIKKHIAPEIVEEVLIKHYTEENSAKVLEYNLEKAFRKYPDQNSYKSYHKCIAYLIKKGFRFDSFIDRVKAFYNKPDH